uniref:uncharacterized protein LOC122604438 n=1 Tax=Erigeron canadensis TaxID=72917 RepID=UPI001CB95C89|nr:uncharacterized protein LOC122604438 [Erigeron canadensis]
MTNNSNFLSLSYINKVDMFLDFAYSNDIIVETNIRPTGEVVLQIKCPCTICKNNHYRPRDVLKEHLLTKGFIRNYTRWVEHGETEIEDAVESSTPMEVDDDHDDGMNRMVWENIRAACFQSNPESVSQEEDIPNERAKQFYDMLEDDNERLYYGCDEWSKLEAATTLLNWKSTCNVTESTFNHILPIFKSMLPTANKLPSNLYETQAILKELRLPKKRYDACKNHCMLFYKQEDLSLTHCQYCKEPRYKFNKVPYLVMTYMPIGERLKRLYMSEKTAKDMIWHSVHKTKEGSMSHPSDGEAWKHFDETHPSLVEDKRNVWLGLCTDGFSPNNTISNPYSLWPVFLTIYNLPPWMCTKDSYIKLSLVIPGRKSPGQNLDVFLQPLIDKLKDLWYHGVEVYDAYHKQNFTMKAMLLWTVSDFPAYAMLSGWSTHGRLACPHCMGNTNSFQLNSGGKPTWFDCHRIHLPERHAFWRDKKGFKKGVSQLSSTVPLELTGEQILSEVSNFPTVYEGRPYSAKNAKDPNFGKTHNWVKKSIFWELPYWHSLLIRHNLDVMHIEKNVFENLFNTIMDTPKTKDNIKARKDIELYCDRLSLHTFVGNNNKVVKPKASYTITKPELKKVCEWLKKVKFPDGYASNIGACVNAQECSFYSFKRHECHVFMQRLLPISLRGMLPDAIWDAVTELCTFFGVICSKVLHIEDLQKLEKSIVVTICKLEKIFPPGFFDSMEHLVIHLTREAIRGGPVQYRWMYPYERKLGILKRTVRNKAKVEGSIVETYIANELSTYCSLHLNSKIPTRLNREPRNFAPENPISSTIDSRLSIFKVPSRRLFEKGGVNRVWTGSEHHKAHTYILLNTEEVHEYIWKFDDWIIEQDPNLEAGDRDKRRQKDFAHWFEIYVTTSPTCMNEHLRDLAFGPLNKVKLHNGYFINGYKFHTLKQSNGRVTQNCGVCVKGACYDNHETSQAEQVYYVSYPSTTRDLKDWSAVVKVKPRGIYQLAEDVSEAVDDDGDDSDEDADCFYQENERLPCLASTNEDVGPIFFEQREVDNVVNNIAVESNSEEEESFDDLEEGSDSEDIDVYFSDHSSN